MGRFNVVINPLAMDGIERSGVSSLKHVFSNKLITIWQADKLTEKWQHQLESPDFIDVSIHRFQWDELVFVMTTRTPGTTTVVQTVVPLNLFWNNYAYRLIFAWLSVVLVGVLLYLAVKPIFIRWGQLKYRINRLLTEDNILCMYQPIIDLATQRPVGCEVLMRLRDGQSIIFPDIAIPAITDRGLTWRLDQLVVRKALQELAAHLPQLSEFKVAFNFFPDNMVSDNVCALFQEAVKVSPHPGLRFELEVLEQHYQDSLVVEVAKLRNKGFLLAVDDFGTGYSNLGSIKAISPDFLKIDRSFVHDMEDESMRSSLIPEIVSIGRAVGAQIIAEGIENGRQMDLLLKRGIEYGQGYYFARPAPVTEFADYLRRLGF
jgi:EAL domain-containing protein (putative c-di-GMP-specific phosphodiesterase class I)